MNTNNGYIVIVRQGNLKIDVEEYDDNKRIAEYIGCDCIDHSSAFDELDKNNIDVWVDDEGLLKEDTWPVFIFTLKGDISGYLVGDMAFLKHDNQGETFGLNEIEKDAVIRWINSHRYITMDTGLLKGGEKSNKYIQSFIVDDFETKEHRQRLTDLKKWVEDSGGEVLGI